MPAIARNQKAPRILRVRVSVNGPLLQYAGEFPAFRPGRFISESERVDCLIHKALDNQEQISRSTFFRVEDPITENVYNPLIELRIRYGRKVPKETAEECNRILEEAKEAVSVKLKTGISGK